MESRRHYQIVELSEARRECERNLIGHSGPANAMTIIQAGLLASGSSDQTIKLWPLQKHTRRTLVWRLITPTHR